MKEAKWFELLVEQNKDMSISIERLESMGIRNGYEILGYVLRTLDVLDGIKYVPYREEIKKALQWSEVAKCGSETRRVKDWYLFNLSAHNEGSCDIFKMYNKDVVNDDIICGFIRYHGTIGQYLRGEVSTHELQCLQSFLLSSGKDDVANRTAAMKVLTQCVIAGVDEKLWEEIGFVATASIELLANGKIPVNNIEIRLRRMHPGFNLDVSNWKYRDDFEAFTFWYPEVALSMFSDDVFLKFIEKGIDIVNSKNKTEGVFDFRDVSFKSVSDFIYYDYKGKKRVNIYKQRMIESYFNGKNAHVTIGTFFDCKVAVLSVYLSTAAKKLVDFFVSAEEDTNLEYHKAIVMMCDYLGLRKDSFDRLNNETDYLDTMDDISSSRKGEILDWVIGNSIVDVGSGSGVLLNKLEEKFPNKNIIGTDISREVIDRLKKKAEKEGHNWNVIRHNFVYGKLNDVGIPFKVDTIIFSSIVHEIFSFSDPRYNLSTVKNAFINAYNSLNPGGRIIIRDGVKTGTNKRVDCHVNEDALIFFENFKKDFKGLPDYDRSDIEIDHPAEDMVKISADIDYIREFLYTYTWGVDSYPQEVQEQFGYMTLKEFVDFFNMMGANILTFQEYLEPGYPEHLPFKLYDSCTEEELMLPCSNCIVVIEKPME